MRADVEIWFEEYKCDYCGDKAKPKEGLPYHYYDKGWFAIAPLSGFDSSKVFCCLDHLQAWLAEKEAVNG